LNVGLYKTVYLSLSTITVMDFYKGLCIGLGITPMHRKIDMFKQIQDAIKTYVNDRKITPIIVLDEAQYLRADILNDLKMLLNFDIDSKDYAVLILVGQPILNDMLSRNSHEALKQRIVVNYNLAGLELTEVEDYLKNRLTIAGINENIIEEGAIKAIASNCNGSTRKLNSIMENCLMICEQKKENIITTEIAMLAENELSLI
jgi:type II secretory pathway predicted ATPase ExeA